jgi:hypothetical protein
MRLRQRAQTVALVPAQLELVVPILLPLIKRLSYAAD